MTMLEAALQYARKGYSIIPVKRDKTPFIKWEPYQNRKASEEEIRSWFKKFPDANIAIVTGEISNLFVVDTDNQQATDRINEAIPEGLEVPCQRTPSGFMHFLFSHCPGFSNRAKVADQIDVRTSGGYFVAAPSINGNGKGWEWVVSPFDADPPELALAVKDILINSFSLSLYKGDVDKENEASLQTSTISTNVYKMFEFHSRNQDLFHVALQLFKGKTKREVIIQVIESLGKICDPPWGSVRDDCSILEVIESALKYYKKSERNLAAEVKQELLSTEGDFLSTELESRLQLSTREEKKNLWVILKRLSEEARPIIRKKGSRHGSWTTIDNTLEVMDFLNVNLDDTIKITLPLDIHKKTVFFPKSIIILAGVTGFGKSTFALNFIRQNWNKYCPIYYFNSEMSPQALNRKLRYFRDTSLEEWSKKIVAIGGWDYKSIAGKIYPNSINVVDYLEPEGGEAYGIHGVIVDIIKRLDKGIAFITIQKKPGSDLGVGGIYSVKASSLALNLEWGVLKIYKNRFREEDSRPDLDMINFDIVNGSEIQAKEGWYNSHQKKSENRYKSFLKED